MDDQIVKGVSMTSEEDDVQFMRMAIEAAREGRRTPGGACVGAALVCEGQAACITFNEGEMQHDPTAHAEIVAIRRLCAKLNTSDLKGYTIYCTLQPCGMCTMACLWAGISRIVYGAGRDDVHTISKNTEAFDMRMIGQSADQLTDTGLTYMIHTSLGIGPRIKRECRSAQKNSLPDMA
jgi:tRNA(adenine34) deaminase